MKAFSVIGIQARKKGNSGAYKAWMIARNLDVNGAGQVPVNLLHDEIEKYKSIRTRERWIAEAIELNFLRLDRDRYFYSSPAKIANILECTTILKPVLIDTKDFVGMDCNKILYGGIIEQGKEDKPISRHVKTQLTGISRQTQWNLEKNNRHVKVIHNFVKIGKATDKLIQKLKHMLNVGALRIFAGNIVQQLPNNYVGQNITLSRQGATVKYRKALSSLRNAKRDTTKVKLYYLSKHSADKASQKFGESKYYFKSHHERFNLWGCSDISL